MINLIVYCLVFQKTKNSQIFITPHIGGMTIEAQHTAFTHAARLLIKFSR